MELLCLLSSIICNSLTSLALSIILPFRRLFLSPATTHTESVTLYEGVVWHQRRRPVHHSFNYRVRYALFELDRHTHAPPNHLSADEARTAAGTTGPVFLLTIPPSVGYEQNPLSLYYCYDLEDSTRQLKKCIAEVTNTPWGERVSFVFSPSSDLVAKPLHVSPFMDMLGNWRIKATEPGDDLSVSILVQHPHLGEYFCATLRVKRVPPSMVPDHTLFFWLMPHKVAVWIYWHALKLWWKNVAFIQHHRYANPAYREEASLRDQKLNCFNTRESETNGLCPRGDGISLAPRFTWTDAKWPWS